MITSLFSPGQRGEEESCDDLMITDNKTIDRCIGQISMEEGEVTCTEMERYRRTILEAR